MFLARCILFTPANKPERFAKAKELGSDGVVIDLEDSVSLAGKDDARSQVLEFLKTRNRDKSFLQCLRINSIRTCAGLKDLTMLCDTNVRPDILVLPKVESANEIEIINELLSPKTISIIPLIETAKGLFKSRQIASARNVVGLLFGGADFAADLGATMAWDSLYAARAQVVLAAAQAGITAIDVPYLQLNDADDSGIIAETKAVKAMGFTCKFAIHPKHIKPIIQTFSSTSEEIENAKDIVAAYDEAKGNACEFNGKMIDVPVYRSAQRILAILNI